MIGWQVAAPGGVFFQDTLACLGVAPRLIRGRFHQDFDPSLRRRHRQQPEPQHPAEPVRSAVTVPAPFCRGDRQPDVVGGAHAVEALQHEFQGEAEVELADHEDGRFGIADGDDVAAPDLPFDGEALGFEEGFDGGVEGGFGDATRHGGI